MRKIKNKTGIYGWTLVPFEGFYRIVLCGERQELNEAQEIVEKTFDKVMTLKRYGGTLHYMGHEYDRWESAKDHISNILELGGTRRESL